MARAAPDLVAESGAVPGGVGGQLARLGEGPADAAVPADEGGLVGDREDGGETDAEAADGAVRGVGVALGGGAQRGQRLDAGRVQGAPVLAAISTPSRRVRRRRPGTRARAAASAAFCAA